MALVQPGMNLRERIKQHVELFDVYYKLLQEVLPNFAGTIFTNLSDRITIRKIAGM